jgi:hypothetical protein
VLKFLIHSQGPAVRWRIGLRDFFVLLAVLVIGLGLAYKYDFLKKANGVAVHRTVEVDEALILGGVLVAGFLGLSARRYAVRRREEVRLLATEEYVQTPAFQRALKRFVGRRPGEDTREQPSASLEKK